MAEVFEQKIAKDAKEFRQEETKGTVTHAAGLRMTSVLPGKI